MHKLAFLGRSRELDFSVEDCRNPLACWDDQDRASVEMRAITSEHLERIKSKIAALYAIRDTLSYLVQPCAGNGILDCPILKNLEKLPT